MGGTDLMDQSISYYKFERKTRGWTLRFAFYVIEVMINNSFLKYKIVDAKISRIEFILKAIDVFLDENLPEENNLSTINTSNVSQIKPKENTIAHFLEHNKPKMKM